MFVAHEADERAVHSAGSVCICTAMCNGVLDDQHRPLEITLVTLYWPVNLRDTHGIFMLSHSMNSADVPVLGRLHPLAQGGGPKQGPPLCHRR